MTRGATPEERHRLAMLVARVAADQRIDAALLAGAERSAELVRIRFALVWVARTALAISFTEIAAVLGGRNRATLIHAARRAEAMRRADRPFRALTDRLLLDTIGSRDG